MRPLATKIVFAWLGFFLLAAPTADALVCPDAVMPIGTNWCDEDLEEGQPSRYIDDTLCIVEPIAGGGGDIDDEIVGGGVCILGKFKAVDADSDGVNDHIENLVDMVVSSSFVTDPLLGAFGLFVPQLAVLGSAGEFMTTFPLEEEGVYDIGFQVRLYEEGGSCDDHYRCLFDSRRILRLASPHLTVVKARVTGTSDNCDAAAAGCLGVQDTIDQYADADPVSVPDHAVEITPTGEAGGISGRTIELCIRDHDTEASAGSQVVITAFNTITDSSVTPAKQLTLEKGCLGEGQSVCQQDTTDFCEGGYVLAVPVGHGENKVELFVNNPVTGFGGFEAGEWVSIDPFMVDLKGPTLCVTYLNENEAEIDNADGNVILASEAEQVIVDVTLGLCGEEPETISLSAPEDCNLSSPEVCNNHPICAQRNNNQAEEGAEQLALCMSEGDDGHTHYQFRLSEPRYPVTTFKLLATDNLGNRTVETHAFGYGTVRSLFTAEGELDLENALIPDGLGGFIPKSFITGKIEDLVVQAVNTDKFKDEIFLKLLEPRQPVTSEISCLNDLEGEEITGSGLKCTFDHLANADRIVTFKLFESNGIGSIQIPSFYFLNDNRIWLQLKINGFRGRGEMFTIRFRDSDGDGKVDTEDSDDDNDGVKDKDDPDDDNDGVPDERDLPGRIIPDPDFGFYIMPIKLAVKELAINMQLTLQEGADGKLKVVVDAVPDRDLIEAIADGDFLIELDCEKDISETFQGGRAGEPGNGMYMWIDSEACRAMERLVNVMDTLGASATFQERKMQGINEQFQCTFNAMVRCSIPQRALSMLEKFEDEPVLSLSLELFDRNFNFDFFSPLLSSDLNVDSTGISFEGGGLLLTGGVSDGAVTAEEFLEDLPEEFKNEKFGPLAPALGSFRRGPNPVTAATEMGEEINLAMKEETINSTVHTSVMLLWDLANAEGDGEQSLDLSNTMIRDVGMGIPDIGNSICLDKDGEEVSSNSFRCFPFPLNIENVLGPSTLDYVDFDGDGVIGTPKDAIAPLILRNSMDPLGPATVRIVDVTPLGGWSASGSTEPAAVIAEIELGLRRMPMAVYEEKVQDWDASPIKGTGVIKSWCDPDRFPGMNPATCDADKNMPIARFNASGRVFVTLLLSINDVGLIEAEAGVSSVEKAEITDEASPMELDRNKTYLQFNVTENNTIVPDDELAAALQGGVEKLLPFYLFGNARDIRLRVPTMMPLANFCAEYPEVTAICDCVEDPEAEGCSLVKTINDLWADLGLADFGVEGFTLLPPLLGVTGPTLGPIRYLTIGTGIEFLYTDD